MNKRLLILFAFTISMVGITYANKTVSTNTANSSIQITTNIVRYVGVDTAISGGEIVNPNNENILSAGICWSKNPNPTVNDFKVIRQGSSNSFTCIMKNLQPKTGYFTRAYVETNAGIIYGQECSFATDSIRMGMFIRGGELFYILKQGDPGYIEGELHGLVVSPIVAIQAPWDNGNSIFVGATDSAVFTGKLNTDKIVAALGSGYYAAKLCDDLVLNGYSDWYLPSLLETKLMKKYCWSSTELSTTIALYNFSRRTTQGLKSLKRNIYAIRTF
jgi:hypothetical protein